MKIKFELNEEEILAILADYFQVKETDIAFSGDVDYGIYADIVMETVNE